MISSSLADSYNMPTGAPADVVSRLLAYQQSEMIWSQVNVYVASLGEACSETPFHALFDRRPHL